VGESAKLIQDSGKTYGTDTSWQRQAHADDVIEQDNPRETKCQSRRHGAINIYGIKRRLGMISTPRGREVGGYGGPAAQAASLFELLDCPTGHLVTDQSTTAMHQPCAAAFARRGK